jgi:hypothetical protein
MSDGTKTRHDEAVAENDEWCVYQCPHGCVHVRLNNVTLTFTEPDFQRLVHLLRDAFVRLSVRDAARQVRPH